MTSKVIYEVECSLDPEVVADFDTWLPGHVRKVLACPGFSDARIQALQGEPARRRIQFRLESQAALDRYLEHDAPRLRLDGQARFGSKMTATRRLLATTGEFQPAAPAPPACLDCGAPVAGKHCPNCGQARDVRVLSMREVAGDVTHSILHLDSRAWRTLRMLVLRPGELTREFIAGRHQRYLPPFRLYLVISVLFFALTAILPGAELLAVDERVSAPAAGQGGSTPSIVPKSAGCNFKLSPENLLGRFERSLERACLQVRADGAHRLAALFQSTVPRLMFLFLPLMAAVALLFYWRPRRLYVEHLVYFLHTHALVFLVLSVVTLCRYFASLELPLIGLLGFMTVAVLSYLPYYLFRSMRVVYCEGRLATSMKFAAIGAIYFVLLFITIMVGLLYSMLQL